jgi:SPP1 gp7 family putative phage head morphogenesis protein
MRAFKRQLLAKEQDQMTEMARRWLDLERTLDGKIAALAEEFTRMAAQGTTPTRGKLIQMDRYHALLAQTNQELQKYTNYAEALIEGQQRSYAQLGLQHAFSAIDASVETAAGTRFNRLNIDAVEHLVGLAGDGSPLRQLLVDAWPTAAQGMTEALIRGVGLGQNPRVTARQMADGATGSLNRMMNVARTEQLRVYRESSRQAYLASGVVKGYKRLATRDDRVCPACLMADGQRYELGEVMAEHPSGRCALVPIVSGYPAATWQQGPDWFQEQSPDTQRAILGTGRYTAWRAGKFDLDQLVTVKSNATWGDSLQATPLKDLVG